MSAARSIDWDRARKLVAQRPDKINLNAGTLSPTPLPVLEAVTRLRELQAQSPSDFHWRQTSKLLTRSRESLARYLNCATAELVLLPNVTFAVNLVAQSLARRELSSGDRVLMTDHEYGAMRYCWQRIAAERGLHIDDLRLPYRTEDPDEIVEAFRAAVTPRTRVVFFSHGTTTTGLVLPAAKVVAALRALDRDDLFIIIDGAHAPGMVPVDLRAIGADFYGANCHKWMMAPAGAGFLHVAARHQHLIEPLITSWGWDYDRSRPNDESGWGGTFFHRNLEFNGTLDRCPQMVLPDLFDFRNDTLGGEESIRSRSQQIVDHARRRLTACGFAPATPYIPELSGSIIAFDYPCDDVNWFRDAIWNDHHIECPVTTAVGQTFLRVSCGWFNTPEEVDRLADAASELRRKR